MARKIILYIAQSLDGYIAGKNHDLSWLPPKLGKDMSQFYADFFSIIDTVIMGHNTYKQVTEILSPNKWPYSHCTSYVWTRTAESKKSKCDAIVFINKDISGYCS